MKNNSNLRKFISVAFILIVLLSFSNKVEAQFDQKLKNTFGDKNAESGNDIIEQFLKFQENKKFKAVSKNASVTKFKSAGNSGVAESLADALGQNSEQKAVLTEVFEQIKQGYEAEVAKEGKSNDLAAALTFFIAVNVMTYYQTEPASDQATDELFKELQTVISSVPAFAGMNDAEKQKMHDWLVCMGGFAMTNYMDAKQSGNSAALANIKTFADYSLRLVLGVEAANLKLSANGLTVQGVNSVSSSPVQSVNSKIVGTWSRKASVGFGTAPGAVLTYQGYQVSRYNFNSNGTYTFKSEMWNGYLRSEEWWTTEESGTFAVTGNTLTISPGKSVATARNRTGVVQKTQNNSLEPTAYNWKLHLYEGINETVLVLQPSAATKRDGQIGTDSNFPNAYVYDQTSIIEWKF